MEFFLSHTEDQLTLALLNRCRFFLQVILVSDITSANGQCVLLEVNMGNHSTGGAPYVSRNKVAHQSLIGIYGVII
jgi:hypothetical protein